MEGAHDKGGIQSPRFVAFLSDFGLRDSYVAEMYAALWAFCPGARAVAISHQVPSADVGAGAHLLGRAARWFPEGTIFVAVVDPGVGSERQAVAVRSGGRLFVAPDNGLLSRAIDWDADLAVRVLGWSDVPGGGASVSFHGRDLFAPVAGMLAGGKQFEEIGQPGVLKGTFPPEKPSLCGGEWTGEVVYIDRFGDIATNLPNGLEGLMELAGVKGIRRSDCYAAGQSDEPFWLNGSAGCIEVAVRGGSAAQLLGIKVGDRVRLRIE